MTFSYSPKSGTVDVAALQRQVEELSQRLEVLETVLRVTAGTVELKASGTLRLQAPMIYLN